MNRPKAAVRLSFLAIFASLRETFSFLAVAEWPCEVIVKVRVV
jgi:hypothetical protein